MKLVPLIVYSLLKVTELFLHPKVLSWVLFRGVIRVINGRWRESALHSSFHYLLCIYRKRKNCLQMCVF